MTREQDLLLQRAAGLGFGNGEVAEMTGLGRSKVRYRRDSLGLPTSSRVASTRNTMRRKSAPDRAEWVISLGVFRAFLLGSGGRLSISEVILGAYEDYLIDYEIRVGNAEKLKENGLSVPEKVEPNIYYQSCIRMAEGCLLLEPCPCKKMYSVVDLSDDENDMVPRGCPCNRLSGKDEVLGQKRTVQVTDAGDNEEQKSVAAE
ncbi:MAG: hypothetical protein ACFHHU_00775 [Porticoccaceae bacterium]